MNELRRKLKKHRAKKILRTSKYNSEQTDERTGETFRRVCREVEIGHRTGR